MENTTSSTSMGQYIARKAIQQMLCSTFVMAK